MVSLVPPVPLVWLGTQCPCPCAPAGFVSVLSQLGLGARRVLALLCCWMLPVLPGVYLGLALGTASSARTWLGAIVTGLLLHLALADMVRGHPGAPWGCWAPPGAAVWLWVLGRGHRVGHQGAGNHRGDIGAPLRQGGGWGHHEGHQGVWRHGDVGGTGGCGVVWGG